MPRRSNGRLVALVVPLLLLGHGTSRAGGFHSPYQSATAAGTAFAGASARADDAGFFLYNPATIGDLDGFQTWFDARAFLPDARIEAREATSALGAGIAADGPSGNIAGRALALGSVTVIPIAEGLSLGLGSSAPFATDIETTPQWAGRFHLTAARMVGLNAAGALAWEATPWLTLSGGLQVQRFETEFRNNALVLTPKGIIEARAVLDAEPSWTLGAVGGLVLKPAEGTRLGLGWRSAMTHEIEGVARTNSPLTPVERLSFDLDLPQTLSLGLEQRLAPDLRLFAEAQWVDWSRFKGFDIAFESGRPNETRPIAWKDTWLYAIGLGYKVRPSTELTAGLGYDTAAAINASGTTISADASKTTLGVGLLETVPGLGRISLSYAHIIVHDARVAASSPASGEIEGRLEGHMETFGASFTRSW